MLIKHYVPIRVWESCFNFFKMLYQSAEIINIYTFIPSSVLFPSQEDILPFCSQMSVYMICSCTILCTANYLSYDDSVRLFLGIGI